MLTTVAIAFCCFGLSIYTANGFKDALNGHRDCRGLDGISLDGSCADSITIGNLEAFEFKSKVFFYCGIVFLSVPLALLIIAKLREGKSGEDAFSAIKFFPNQTK